ncbi:MAG: class I SAM-dependent DNA methyltransferase [Giesbergeria sp.]|uniref:class I SAM-dependent DNA methyltransferase n=1 Tax=Giesbergeria sp. TaxID=2818473 RepID=UPI0026396C36|nr:DNA methyltransferase [Giesbergeria sp.]MDD2609009.1 class I SAM-dependent DNA methyltransferase [Giesbergeria sp.]
MPLSWNEIKSRALTFSRTWADASNEDAEAKPFWLAFFEIFGITDKRVATFELNVKKLGQAQGFVDLFWPGMLLVEHKSRGKNLDRAFQQALDYVPGLPERDLPQLIIVCDFARFRLYRLATGESIEFALADLHQHIQWFGFIAGYRVQQIRAQDPVNVKAAERMGQLHDALHASGYTGHHLELLLVRVLFCLFADDTGIFQPAQSFRAFIEERTSTDGSDLGLRLGHLFQALNTPPARRSAALDMQVAAFPYINGKLFEEILPFADFDFKMREVLLNACALDWSAISPAIFGSLFQSIMDSTARRNLGAHYTSEENILKLIGPLFLDDLRAEFNRVKGQRQRLQEFHQKLRQITFFDPACGCGNFLVISYRELRLLELEVLRASHALLGKAGQQSVDVHNLIGVDVDQCYGIEIEEFPAQIAQVALWLIDHQMNLRVSEEFGLYFARIPLNTSPHIVHGNALQLDWQEILPVQRCSFVLGNPPFLGKKEQSLAQKSDFEPVTQQIPGFGVLDFVAAWYVKAAQYLHAEARDGGVNTPVRCAFVSTNSIVQGEQVGVLWSWMLAQGIKIQFAHRTFGWSNEAKGNAAVHCVIIGFGLHDVPNKVIFEYDDVKGPPHAVPAHHINPYLVDAPNVLLTKKAHSICHAPSISYGSMANDNGHLLLLDEEKQLLLANEPELAPFIRPYMGAQEFLNGEKRWCFWLEDASPVLIRDSPELKRRIAAVQAFRHRSNRKATQKLAMKPTLFGENRQPKNPYLLLPKVSSERRFYLPIGYIQPEVIANGSALTIEGAGLFEFGVLQSSMHAAWMRLTAGRLESRYQYSAAIVYNNFPWPDLPHASAKAPVQKVQAAIEQAAQAVLDARAQFSEASLADLYDPLAMPPALVKAHQRLDAAVDKAYALCGGPKSYASDAQRVAFLFLRYQQLTSLLPATPASKPRRTRLA